MHERPGDSLIAPFQCDWCWSENIEARRPDPEIYSDIQTLGYIRRENLDIFGSREKRTVANVLMNINKGKT